MMEQQREQQAADTSTTFFWFGPMTAADDALPTRIRGGDVA